jgi:hypothetical protein
MPRFQLPRGAVAAALVLLAACSDDTPALPAPPEPPDLTARDGAPSSIPTRPRFTLDLQANGALRPGSPIQLVLTATGTAETPEADVEIVLPEVAAAEASSWTDYRPITDRPIPSAASRRVALGVGGRTVLQHTVTFPVPGYYTVLASARARDSDSIPDLQDGELLLDESHTVLYLLVDEQGGRMMATLDRRAMPPTSVGLLGPRHDRTGVAAPPANLARPPRPRAPYTSPAPSATLLPRTPPARQTTGSTMKVVTRYHDWSSRTYKVVPGADFYLSLYNSSFGYIGSRGGNLAADGSVLVGCGEGYYAELSVYAWNDHASVGGVNDFRYGQEVVYVGFYPGTDCAKGTVYADATPIPSHVFVSLNLTAAGAQRHFGRTRPRMAALITADTTVKYSTYCATTTFRGCNVDGEGDFLRIQTDSTKGYGQQVWGQSGVWITSHEYGHAFHEKALGGFVRYYGGCNTTVMHSLTTLNVSMPCALPEGFADYFAVITRPDETGYDYATETNYYYRTYLAGQDGSRAEGAIAAFFYDLVDANRWGTATSPPDTFDVVAYPGTVVGDVINGCQVYQGGTWIFNNGIDHLVYCFERKVDPAVTGSTKYFPTRSPDPTSYSVASTVTSATEVRKLWRRNLYNE